LKTPWWEKFDEHLKQPVFFSVAADDKDVEFNVLSASVMQMVSSDWLLLQRGKEPLQTAVEGIVM